MPEKINNLKETILGKIKKNEILMHPKYYFWLRVVAITLVAAAALLISIFIFNFILFGVRINSDDALFFHGPRGWGAFVLFFPWHLLALDVLLLAALLWLLRQFRFGYRSPMLYLLGGLFLVTFAAGFILDRTSGINEHLMREANEHRLPSPLGDFYRGVRHPRPDFMIEINQPPQGY